MSVSTIARLRPSTRISDVANAIAAFYGFKLRKVDCGAGVYYTLCDDVALIHRVPGVSNATIKLRAKHWDYNFEGDGGYRILYDDSTPKHIALLRRLILMFGGSLQYRDTTSDWKPDFEVSKPIINRNTEAGNKLAEDFLLEMKEGRPEEIEECRHYAEYGDLDVTA